MSQNQDTPEAEKEKRKLTDLKKKVEILKRIKRYHQVLLSPRLINRFPTAEACVMYLTDEPFITIKKAQTLGKSIDMKEWLKQAQESPDNTVSCLQISNIHDIIYNNYVKNGELLTLEDVKLKTAMKTNKIYDEKVLLKILREQGYIWRKLDNTNKCLLMENSEQQAERIKYLLQMKEFRRQNRVFIYIEEKQVATHIKVIKNVLIAASPQLGLVNISTRADTDKWFDNFIKEYLKPSYVVVFGESTSTIKSIKPPKPEDTKREMVEWLEKNNISAVASMPRAELYHLIQLYGDVEETCSRDEILKANGIDVIHQPKGWPLLNYFNQLWRIEDIWQSKPSSSKNPNSDYGYLLSDRLLVIANNFNLEKWRQWDENLSNVETSIYERDMEIEEVVDSLLTMAKYEDLSNIPLSKEQEVVEDPITKYGLIIKDTWNVDCGSVH